MNSVRELKRRALSERRGCVRLRGAARRTFSHLGGLPELPAGVEWPIWNGAPLAFLAQIDLAAAPKEDWPAWLPRDGKLFFFYDAEGGAWGAPEQRGSWAVVFAEAAMPLIERTSPTELHATARYRRKDIKFTRAQSIPCYERLLDAQDKRLSDEDFEKLLDLYEEIDKESEGPLHRLFGWPSVTQNDDMELACQFGLENIPCGGDGFENKLTEEIGRAAAEWQLLLQLGSDDDTGMMWGDGGMLFFWVRPQDAARRDFSNVWMVRE